MARDPFLHQPETGQLESTTAMTSVSATLMKEVGRRAAKMVDKAAHAGEDVRPAGRKASRKATAAPGLSAQGATQAVGQGLGTENTPDETAQTAEILADAVRQTAIAAASTPIDGPLAAEPGTDEALTALETAAAHSSDVADSVMDDVQESVELAQHEMGRIAEQTVDSALDAVHGATDAMHQASTDADALVAQATSGSGHAEAEAVRADAPQASSAKTTTLAELNARLAEAMRANIDSTMSFWTSLMDARSMPEAAELNAQHLRRQINAFAAQSRDLASLTQKLALDALRGFAPRV